MPAPDILYLSPVAATVWIYVARSRFLILHNPGVFAGLEFPAVFGVSEYQYRFINTCVNQARVLRGLRRERTVHYEVKVLGNNTDSITRRISRL